MIAAGLETSIYPDSKIYRRARPESDFVYTEVSIHQLMTPGGLPVQSQASETLESTWANGKYPREEVRANLLDLATNHHHNHGLRDFSESFPATEHLQVVVKLKTILSATEHCKCSICRMQPR